MKASTRAFRYDDLVHDFAFDLYFVGGNQAYQFLHGTLLKGIIPSLDTVLKRARVGRFPITQVGFIRERFQDLPNHLSRFSPGPVCPFIMTASDATGVIKQITWAGPQTDQIHGLVIRDKELSAGPICAGTSYDQLTALMQKYPIATLINRYMAVPLDPRMPPYDLGFFAQTSGCLTREEVAARWDTSEDYLASLGIYQLFVSADGAPDQLAAQHLRQLRIAENVLEVAIPSILPGYASKFIQAPARHAIVSLAGIQVPLLVPRIPIQDPLHEGGKIRNSSLKRSLTIGGQVITYAPLLEYLSQDSSAGSKLDLRKTDINLVDRQDCKAQLRLAGTKVLDWLHTQMQVDTRCKPLYYFLQLLRFAVFAFIDPTLSVEQRVYKVSYAKYFVEGWRLHLMVTGRVTAECITRNAWDCIVMNMEALLLFLSFIMQHPQVRKVVPFAPWRWGTQDVEHGHRDVRRQRKYELCTVTEYLIRAFFSEVHAEVVSKHRGTFHWPEHKKHFTLDELHHEAGWIPDDLTMKDINSWVLRARDAAIVDLIELGATIAPLSHAHFTKLEEIARSFLADEVADEDHQDLGQDAEASVDDLEPIFSTEEALSEFLSPPAATVDRILKKEPPLPSHLAGFAPQVSICNPLASSHLKFDFSDGMVHKNRACIELSMHSRATNSKDRLLRVREKSQVCF